MSAQDTGSIVPPTPLGGEADAASVPGLGNTERDETIPTVLPEFDEGLDDLKGATDRDTVTGFARPGDDAGTSGVGHVPDRGTVAGVGTVDVGHTGGGLGGMEGSSAQTHRTTEPLSDQGAVTGADDEA